MRDTPLAIGTSGSAASPKSSEICGQEVLTVCRSGGRASRAAQMLAEADVKVRNVTGGMNEWAATGLPVVRDDGSGRPRLPLTYDQSVVHVGVVVVSGVDGLGPLESKVMRCLWAASSPMAVRQVLDELNGQRESSLAYTTIMTVMARLADKGLLRREREGRGFLYEPAVGDVAEVAVRRLVRDFGDAAVAGFVAEARAQPELLQRLRDLLDAEDDHTPPA